MGGGVSKPQSSATDGLSEARRDSTPNKRSSERTVDQVVPEVPREPTTAIDARIVQTLRELNMTRRQAHAKVRSMNFERIVLRFAMARDAFETIHGIYYQYANESGLNFEGLKEALDALGAQMNETDMREIFYESDMVRDNSLSHNEFVVSLAIAYLLGLITNFECILRTLPPPPDENAEGQSTDRRDSSVSSSRADAPAIISKTLELIVTAYLLFDDDASGTIQIGEVRKVMQKHNEASNRRKLERKSSGVTTKAIRAERIKEMDLNRDGTITFQEFVLTFQNWVGIDEA